MDTHAPQFTRRMWMQTAFATGVLAVARSAWPQQTPQAGRRFRSEESLARLLPAGSLDVIGFFQGPYGYSREEFMTWYEGTHAPDFVVFAGPHLARYTRNYVLRADEGGAPEFKVITEFAYKSEAAKKEIARLFNTPAADGLATHRAPSKGTPPNSTESGNLTNNMISVEEHLIIGPSYSSDPVPTSRRLLVLKRGSTTSEEEFASAAKAFAREVAGALRAPRLRVALFVRRPGTLGFVDALVTIDHAPPGRFSAPKASALQVLHVLEVEAHSSKLS